LVWIDEGEIQVGDSLIEKIREGIDAVDFVVGVISRHSIGSDWVKKELDLASNREIHAARAIVLPALVDDVTLPGFLVGKRYADFRDDKQYDEALGELLRALGPVKALPGRAADEVESLRMEAYRLKKLVDAQARDATRVRRLLAQDRSPGLQTEIDEENKRYPEFAPINEAYAFEVLGIPVTLGYLLHAIRKASMKGAHALDVGLRLENKWNRVYLMVEAYRDYLKLLAGSSQPRAGKRKSRRAKNP